jgi:hypothetical protein
MRTYSTSGYRSSTSQRTASAKSTLVRRSVTATWRQSAGALYETFPPEQARRILSRLQFHYTPKHGSWLNQAEIKISIFERGCLSRLMSDRQTLQQRVGALEAERNELRATIAWQFTNQQARVQLQKLYPMIPAEPT